MLSKTTLALPLMLAVITPMQASAQQHVPGAPASFNGLVWDPPLPQRSVIPDAAIQPWTGRQSRGHRSRSE
jgi:hypothetical protein